MTRNGIFVKLEKPKMEKLIHEWKSRERFFIYLVTTDHKLFFSDKGGGKANEILEQVILTAHNLPGYFMCLGTDLIGPEPFLKMVCAGKEMQIDGLKDVVNYMDVVRNHVVGHKLSMEEIISMSRFIGTDPLFSPIKVRFGKVVEENETNPPKNDK